MNLEAWQARLEGHFELLSRARRDSGWPVFALEHGLAHQELADLDKAIRDQVAGSSPSDGYWLGWVTYAVEKGYRYAGDEYWQTFERDTPGWEMRGDRGWIRHQFHRFRDRYAGATPEGAWANHFTIICWPITHAILPRDLQRHLARTLYELRHAFSADLLESPLRLGELIAARSWDATSRFQNLAQEPLFLGQIAAALLLQGQQGSGSLILPATLDRIALDLDHERRARDWLRAAQGSAQRFHIRGLSPLPPTVGRGRGGPHSSTVAGARSLLGELAIEPRLLLQPESANSWRVQLEFPDLSSLLNRFPGLRRVLGESRGVVAGSSGAPRARGYFLNGPQRVLLHQWPRPEDVLLRFEENAPELEMLLRTECLLRPGPTWLFRIASDGIAYELRSLRVRAPGDYVVIRTDNPIGAGPGTSETSVQCGGVHAARLNIPTEPSPEILDRLEVLGLGLAGLLEAWPAGLPAAAWDGEGRAEWLSTDRPCVGLRTNHPGARILVSLDGEPDVIEIEEQQAIRGAFLELDALPVGLHRLQVKAHGEGLDVAGALEILVRAPRPWRSGTNSHGALFVSVDPPQPTLEEIWEERIRIEAHGPAGGQLGCRVELDVGCESEPAGRSFQLAFPVRPQDWNAAFEKHIRQARDLQNAYDRAQSSRITFDGGDLGVFVLSADRAFVPLRWRVERRRGCQLLTLLDDTGTTPGASVAHYSFKTPDAPGSVDRQDWVRGFEVPSEGGLYLASSGDYTAGVITPPVLAGFGDLQVRPQLQDRPRTSQQAHDLLLLIERWARARMTGGFSLHRRAEVLEALLRQVLAIVGGKAWERAEEEARRSKGEMALQALARAITNKADERPLSCALTRDYRELATMPVSSRVARFADLAHGVLHIQSPPPTVIRHGEVNLVTWKRSSDNPRWLSEFALRLASWPPALVPWSGEDLAAGLARLMEAPSLARAARFLVLGVGEVLAPTPLDSEALYPGWRWP